MFNKWLTTFLASISFLLLTSACGKSKVQNTDDILAAGATGQFGDMYVIYDDELKTGGGLFLYPGEQNQVLDDAYAGTSCFGKRCIRYEWNGGDIYDYDELVYKKTIAGLDLALDYDSSVVLSSEHRDFSAAGYTKVYFSAKGSLSSNVSVKIEAPDDGSTLTQASGLTLTALCDNWTHYSFNIASPDELSNIKEFFKITFIYTAPDGTATNSNGGSIFLDNIYYSK